MNESGALLNEADTALFLENLRMLGQIERLCYEDHQAVILKFLCITEKRPDLLSLRKDKKRKNKTKQTKKKM